MRHCRSGFIPDVSGVKPDLQSHQNAPSTSEKVPGHQRRSCVASVAKVVLIVRNLRPHEHKPGIQHFMKKYLVEFIGTFFLVFTVGTAVRSGAWLAPLAVAWGAAHYGWLRHSGGRRIGGGIARSYYVGVNRDAASGRMLYYFFLFSSTRVFTSTTSVFVVLAIFSESFLAIKPLGSQPAEMARISPPLREVG